MLPTLSISLGQKVLGILLLMDNLNQNETDKPISKSSDYSDFLVVGETAARAAGEVLKDWMGKAPVTEKGPGDFVTQADIASQETIESMIRTSFPTHGFLGEENQSAEDKTNPLVDSEFCWVVDPLDGTTNYIHQLRSFSVSIALLQRGKIVVGIVYDPLLDEMYAASLGGGATLNEAPITVSQCRHIDQSLLVCSFSTNVQQDSIELKRFTNILCNTQSSIRRLGSAALNLAYVACGRLDGYWATSLNIWDMAAGTLILTEAGGVIEHIDGKPLQLDDPQFVAANNRQLLNQASKWLQV